MMDIRGGRYGVLCGIALGAVLALAACGGSSSGTGQEPTESSSTTDPGDGGAGTTEPDGYGTGTTEPDGDDTGSTEPGGDDSGTTEPDGDGTGMTEPDGDGSGPDTPEPPTDTTYPTEPDGGIGTGGGSIAWGPRIGGSDLSPIFGAQDEFGAGVIAALASAARAVPNGASQSSVVDAAGRTADQVTVHVEYMEYDDDVGNLVHVVTDSSTMAVPVPGPLPRPDVSLALFTDLIPGIEPDLSSYPHEVLGVWARDGEVGAFWSGSPDVPPVAFGARTPVGVATYEGDAAGLLAGVGKATKFAANVTLEADFDSWTVDGTVEAFRSLAGAELPVPPLTLGTATFSSQGGPFSGDTTSDAMAGGGKWGARWTDGHGEFMGGTFGFAADGGGVAALGAFTACACAATTGGSPDDTVATSQ